MKEAVNMKRELKDVVNIQTVQRYQGLLEQEIRNIRANTSSNTVGDYHKNRQLELYKEWERINDTFKDNQKVHTTEEGVREVRRLLYLKTD